jgi:1-acyl-sn-glycerol-3-phosphate acyltransferase
MIQPSPEQWSLLSPIERAAFRAGDVFARHSSVVSRVNDTFMAALIHSCGGRRLHLRGLEHLARFGDRDSLLLVSNHRSFFDFYVISAVLYWHTRLPRRMFFPVRSTFFYDHPIGPVVNVAMSGMRMFPPILREKERAAFNIFSLARAVEELEVPGTIMGLHPEGTRNKGDDPYAFLPAQSGVGKVALDAPNAHVIPVFVLGMSSSMALECKRNVTAPGDHPIDVWFGPEIELRDLRAGKARAAGLKKAANRCLDGIKALAEEHRAGRDGVPTARARRVFGRPLAATP